MRRVFLSVSCLLALVAAWFLWPRDPQPVAARNDVAVTPASNASAAVAAVPNAVIAEDLGHPSAATTNRLTYRLANTSKTAGQLTHDRNAILLENAFIDTTAKLTLKIPAHLKASAEPGAYLVQSRGQVDVALRGAIGAAGGQVISYIPNNAFLVQISAAGAALLSENPRVQAVLPYEPYYKVSATLLGRAVNQQPLAGGTFLTLGLYDRSAQATLAQLEKMGAEILTQERSPFGQMVRVRPPQDWISIAQLPGVQRVEAAYRRQVANDLARPAVGVAANSTTSTNYLNLSGSNVLVVVADSGVDAEHPDFKDSTGAGLTRVFGAFSNSIVDIDGHGTHVAGIIAGNGFESTTVTNARGSVNPGTNFQYRGKAPLAKLYSIGFLGANDTNFYELAINDQQLQEMTALTNALIMNNSWRYTGDNEYDLPAASYDAAMRDAIPEETGPQPILAVFAAGNEGGGNDAGSGGAADTIASPATAKNVITVGALEELRNLTNLVTSIDGITNAIWAAETDSGFQVAGYSSRGNVGVLTEGDFGRFKPDVVAPGTFTISTRSTTWDMDAYYNITNYHVNTMNDVFVNTNALAYGTLTIPGNAVGVSIRVVPNDQSPTPFPDFPIYVSSTGTPDPATPATYDFVRSNLVAIPPDSGVVITDISVLKNGGLSYAVADPYTNASAQFDIIETIITTNDLGNQLEVMSNLNNTIGPFYRFESGTSMSAPAVSGVLACIQDFFMNRLQLTPSPALMKAMLINGARAAGSYKFAVTNSINYQGWGLVKLSNSVPLMLTNITSTSSTNGVSIFFVDQSPTNALATGDRRTYSVSVPTVLGRAQPLRVTLAWTDPPGNPAAAVKLVNDLDLVITNTANGQVFFGNQFSTAGTPPFSLAGASNSVADNINNVENIYLSPTLGTNYTITVYAKAVNVNAVTLEQTNVVQDFALVVTSGDGNNTNGFTVTATAPQPTTELLPRVEYLPATNGIYFNRTSGANAPWLNTNDLAISPGYGFYTNSVFHVGQTNQWHFFVVTNTMAAVNPNFTNAAFIVFLPNTQATPRMGVFQDSTGNSTRPEADLELLVASAPEPNAGQLTNLNLSVISNCLFNTNGCASAIGRGGSEFVVFTNSTANQVYYIGVQCQDQMAGQFAFVPIFSDKPFSTEDTNGNVYVNGLLVPAIIPDGNNAHPGVAYMFGLCLSMKDVGRVIVTNTFEHQNFGDLYGALSHDGRGVILNNHVGIGTVNSAQEFIYDDSGRGDYPNSQRTDGPGSLRDFRGSPAIGAWIFNVVDNAYTQTGMVTGFQMKIEPHRDLRNIPFVIVEVPPNSWFYEYVDVPAGYSNLLVIGTNVSQVVAPIPIEMYVKEGSEPTFADTNYFALLTNCITGTFPTGTLPGNTVSVGPPLMPNRYYVGLYNSNNVAQSVQLGAILTADPSTVVTVNFGSSGVLALKDDAVTYDSIYVTQTNTVQNFQVGLRVDHERISDLVFHLIRPDGTRYLLMENRGAQTTNGAGVTIITTNLVNSTAGGTSVAETNYVNVGITHGTLPITYNFYTAPDQMTVYYGTNIDPAYLVYDTGMTNNPPLGPGPQNTASNTIIVSFPPAGISANSTYLTIVMNQYGPTPRTTAWTYTAGGVLTNYAYLTFTENTNLTHTPIKFAPTPFIPVTYTNTVITPVVTFLTNSSVTNFSSFETAGSGSYLSGSNVDNWLVSSNQVSVVNDASNSTSVSNSRFMALAAGTVSRSITVVSGVSNILSYAVRGPGAIGYWRGDNSALDSIGINNGVLTNGVNYTTGKVNQAFNLNGVNQFVRVPAYTNLNSIGNRMTIDFWMFANPANTMATIQGLVDTDHYGVEISYGFGGNNGVNFYVDTTSGSSLISTPNGGGISVTSNQWHHIAGVYDSTKIQLYIDGVPAGLSAAASGNIIPMLPSSYLGIGSDDGRTYCGCGGRYFWGLIDEATLYKRDLSASEIKAIYNAGVGGKYDSSVSFSSQVLAKARISLAGVTTNLFYGSNTNWQTNTISFVATTNTYTLQLDGLTPGMLLDAFSLSSFSAVTNYVTNTVVVTSNLCYLPEQDIGVINGINPVGEWKLEVLDNRAGATNFSGNLVSWELQFTYANTNYILPPVLPNLSTNYYSVIESNTFVMATNIATYSISNATLIYSLAGPTNATINPASGLITWTPTESQAPDTNVFVVTVYDAARPSKIAQNFFQVVAIESNLPPEFVYPGSNSVVTMIEPATLTTNTFNLIVYDPDLPTNTLTYLVSGITHVSGTSSLAGLTVNSSNGIVSVPLDENSGPSSNLVSVIVSDTNPYPLPPGNPASYPVLKTFMLVVQESNRPPVLTLPSSNSITEEVLWSGVATAVDPDSPANTLTFALVNGPAGFTVLPTGTMTWTPSELQGPGVYTIDVKVTDSNPYDPITPSISVTNSFVLSVDEWNIAPTFAQSLQTNTIYETQPWTFNNAANDPDTAFNSLAYTLTVSPAVTNAFIATNGVITWTPEEWQGPGTYVLTTIVVDTNPPAINPKSFSATNVIIVNVLETNSAPVWTNGYPATALDELTTNTISGLAVDLDVPANNVTYSLSAVTTNIPTWVSINPLNGDLTLTPLETDGPSTNVIYITATDDGAPPMSATTNVTIVVNEVNTAPYFKPQLLTNYFILATNALFVTNVASDNDVPLNTLTYSLLSAPPGANIDANTGVIDWPTTNAVIPSTNPFVVKVTDFNPYALFNQNLSATNYFWATVIGANTAPFWTNGYPDVVMDAQTITNIFGTAMDTDLPPQMVTYFLSNSPAWAVINPFNAQITLSPGIADGPSTNQIYVYATDNVLPTPLYAVTNFTVIVNAFNTNTANPTNWFSLLQYNVKGNGAGDWSTNALQVQAIGREIRYLHPDIITFNEIPDGSTSDMLNWSNNILAGYNIVVSTGTDGFIRSAIASRFPIVTSSSHLDGVSLTNYGYNGNFTRDLFEAQIDIPGITNRLHVLATHLKSSASGYVDAAAKRAAEVSAITNFIATNIIALRPYDLFTLSGDMNEANTNTLAIQRLVNSPYGISLTDPRNPFSGGIETFSSTVPSSRIDYIMPCSVLAAHIGTNQVFRSDLLAPPPFGLNGNDSQVASDHLPVLMAFNHPYLTPLNIINLTNNIPSTNTLPFNAVQYYRVNVPTNADISTNALLFATPAGVHFWFSTNFPPSITDVTDVRLLSNVTFGQKILYTNVAPAITPGTTYYLAVQNTNIFTVQFAVKVNFHFVPLAPPIVNIFSVTPTNRLGTNAWVVTWFAPTNLQFHLQWTHQLAPYDNWKEIKGVISYDAFTSPTNAHFHYIDDGSTNRNSEPFGPTRFYRLHILDSPTNTEPVFLKDFSVPTSFDVNLGSTFAITNDAMDWDLPAQTLSYRIIGSLITSNLLVVNTNTGTVSWTPTPAENGRTNIITTIVSDNGVPVQSTTNRFALIVKGLPIISSVFINTNGVNFVWFGATNQSFNVETNADLATTNWSYRAGPITSTNGTFLFVDPNTNAPLMFYRLLLLP